MVYAINCNNWLTKSCVVGALIVVLLAICIELCNTSCAILAQSAQRGHLKMQLGEQSRQYGSFRSQLPAYAVHKGVILSCRWQRVEPVPRVAPAVRAAPRRRVQKVNCINSVMGWGAPGWQQVRSLKHATGN